MIRVDLLSRGRSRPLVPRIHLDQSLRDGEKSHQVVPLLCSSVQTGRNRHSWENCGEGKGDDKQLHRSAEVEDCVFANVEGGQLFADLTSRSLLLSHL